MLTLLNKIDKRYKTHSTGRKDTRFLITTDVYARGFDHSEVNLIINHFLPLKRDSSSSSEDPEIDTNVYLQRFYSCPNGAVFNLLCSDTDDDKIIRKLERVLKQDVTGCPFGEILKIMKLLCVKLVWVNCCFSH